MFGTCLTTPRNDADDFVFISLRELQRGRETENPYSSPHQQVTRTVLGGSSIITFTV